MSTTTNSSRSKQSQLYLPNSQQFGTSMFDWAKTAQQRREVAAMHEAGFAVVAVALNRHVHRVVMFRNGSGTEWNEVADLAHTTAITHHRNGTFSLLMSTRADLLRQDAVVTIAEQASLFGPFLLRRNYRCPVVAEIPEVEFGGMEQIDESMRPAIANALANLQGMLAARTVAEQLVWRCRRAVREVARVLLTAAKIDGDHVAAIVRRWSPAEQREA